MLGNTLTTYITGSSTPIVTTRMSGESDDDFIDRHCRAVLTALQGSGATYMKNTELDVGLTRTSGQSDEAFVAAFDALLKGAA